MVVCASSGISLIRSPLSSLHVSKYKCCNSYCILPPPLDTRWRRWCSNTPSGLSSVTRNWPLTYSLSEQSSSTQTKCSSFSLPSRPPLSRTWSISSMARGQRSVHSNSDVPRMFEVAIFNPQYQFTNLPLLCHFLSNNHSKVDL